MIITIIIIITARPRPGRLGRRPPPAVDVYFNVEIRIGCLTVALKQKYVLRYVNVGIIIIIIIIIVCY